jgi:hypothetical protein
LVDDSNPPTTLDRAPADSFFDAAIAQDAVDYNVLQYWTNVSSDGSAQISRIKEGTYRVTIYADGQPPLWLVLPSEDSN